MVRNEEKSSIIVLSAAISSSKHGNEQDHALQLSIVRVQGKVDTELRAGEGPECFHLHDSVHEEDGHNFCCD